MCNYKKFNKIFTGALKAEIGSVVVKIITKCSIYTGTVAAVPEAMKKFCHISKKTPNIRVFKHFKRTSTHI